MALILNIDTAVESASICIADNDKIIAYAESADTKNHASFLQPAIQKLFAENSLSLNDIDAISVTNGPGSYTGLRVALASAKGLCFALNKPLIALNTLQVMANAVIENKEANNDLLICPMIDARRMEVFTAIYNINLEEVKPAEAIILTEHSYNDLLENNSIVFCGNGANKFQQITTHTNAIFSHAQYNATNMVSLSLKKFDNKLFDNIAYCSPFYGKEFYSTMKTV